jgi:type III restriction enzyme
MSYDFFEQPILNSPYDYPNKHWELDQSGQPTFDVIDKRRRAEFITPIPKPKGRNKDLEFGDDEGFGIHPDHFIDDDRETALAASKTITETATLSGEK